MQAQNKNGIQLMHLHVYVFRVQYLYGFLSNLKLLKMKGTN